jgi:hypothetical protein
MVARPITSSYLSMKTIIKTSVIDAAFEFSVLKITH